MKLDAHENSAHPATPQKGIAALGDFFFLREGRGRETRRSATRHNDRDQKRLQEKKGKTKKKGSVLKAYLFRRREARCTRVPPLPRGTGRRWLAVMGL